MRDRHCFRAAREKPGAATTIRQDNARTAISARINVGATLGRGRLPRPEDIQRERREMVDATNPLGDLSEEERGRSVCLREDHSPGSWSGLG